ncbi:uncharacterized protein BDV14DRAFT_203411 [Aspergillus stella-maris]|uniref:uncharacterized protein n=1 Tax=Aspergillus stella-maris TaxID=1810926 RepID=UPI003CCE40CE
MKIERTLPNERRGGDYGGDNGIILSIQSSLGCNSCTSISASASEKSERHGEAALAFLLRSNTPLAAEVEPLNAGQRLRLEGAKLTQTRMETEQLIGDWGIACISCASETRSRSLRLTA